VIVLEIGAIISPSEKAVTILQTGEITLHHSGLFVRQVREENCSSDR
jgi:hypothetical protein